MQACAFIPTRGGQEEGTCFDLEGKIWQLAKPHGDSAPLDRYTELTLRERAGRAWHLCALCCHSSISTHTWQVAETKSQAEHEQEAAHGR